MSEVRPAITADIDRTVITNSILPKSWKCPHCGQRQKMSPFGDETLIEFGKHIQHCKTCGYLHLWELNLTDDFKKRVVGMLVREVGELEADDGPNRCCDGCGHYDTCAGNKMEE